MSSSYRGKDQNPSTIDTLKKACLSLDVEVTGSKAKKDTFALAQDKYICTHRSKSYKYCHDRC